MKTCPARLVTLNAATLLLLVLLCTGCVHRMQSMNEHPEPIKSAVATLLAIKVSDDADQVQISADTRLTYSFYKSVNPPKAVVDLAQTEPGAVSNQVGINKGAIKGISVERHDAAGSFLTRIEIALANDEDVIVTSEGADKNKLLVVLKKQQNQEKVAAVEVKPQEQLVKVEDLTPASAAGGPVAALNGFQAIDYAQPAVKATGEPTPARIKSESWKTPAFGPKVLTAITTSAEAVELVFSGGSPVFTTFRLSEPKRLVIDVPDAKDSLTIKTIGVDKLGFGKARIGASPGKLRIVLDAAASDLPPYQVVKSDQGIRISLKGSENAAFVSKPAARPVTETPAVATKPVTPAVAAMPVAQAASESIPAIVGAAKVKPAEASPASIAAGPSIVEKIDFTSVGEFSQIAIKVSGACQEGKPQQVSSGWALTFKNCQLPKNLQRTINTASFASSVTGITPYQVKVGTGYEAKLLVKVRSNAPFNFRREKDTVLWEIRNPEGLKGPAPLPVAAKTPAVQQKAIADPAAETSGAQSAMQKQLEATPVAPPAVKSAKMAQPLDKELTREQVQLVDKQQKVFSGRRVTLEFSDAEVRKIFQLIAEVSNLNFLVADDVTGSISLKLVNVPWDQALEVILESKGLEKRQEGNILYIKPKGKFRTAEQEEAAVKEEREKRMEIITKLFDVNFASVGDIASQFDKLKSPRGSISQDARTNRVIVTDNAERLLRMQDLLSKLDAPEKQVMIEARIVEATSTFTRDLGVQWGLHYRDGSSSVLGINQLDTGFGGIAGGPPTSGTFGPGAAVGMSFGKLTSNIQLDLRLAAAASAGLVKIISTPKVVTLNNKTAKISQGQSIPYLSTSAEGTKTEFIQATLSLNVTPHVTADGNIGLKVQATNNSPGTGSPPSINTKEATTELQVMNGETTVIGGIYVDSDTESNTGVPFLMDIPLLGWLFKSNSKQKTKTELLIFITPRIVS